jgi:hypothetical protein
MRPSNAEVAARLDTQPDEFSLAFCVDVEVTATDGRPLGGRDFGQHPLEFAGDGRQAGRRRGLAVPNYNRAGQGVEFQPLSGHGRQAALRFRWQFS